MKKIDVYKIVEEFEKEHVEETRAQIEDYIQSINGQNMQPGEIIEKVVAPLIGITNSANKVFTIELVQRVVDELSGESKVDK